MDANGSYYPTYDPYGSFGSTPEPETHQSAAASVYGGGSAQSKLDDEFFDVGDWMEDDPSTLMGDSAGYPQNSPHRDQVVQLSGSSLQHENTVIRESGKKEKIAFKTKSDIEILDDGFKWRKYGKKMVKNSPNPRNYYRCSVEGCPVKKRVERDKEDYKYVITTYEGTHNHEGSSKF